MIFKKALNYPILMMGIIIFSIFLMDANRRGVWKKAKDRFTPTSCRAVLVKLNKAIPETWSTNCNENNMEITINVANLDPTSNQMPAAQAEQQHRAMMYRELANNLTLIARNSPIETLERVHLVLIKQQSSYLQINSVTEGKDLAKLATTHDPKFIRQLLHSTVQTQEKILRHF